MTRRSKRRYETRRSKRRTKPEKKKTKNLKITVKEFKLELLNLLVKCVKLKEKKPLLNMQKQLKQNENNRKTFGQNKDADYLKKFETSMEWFRSSTKRTIAAAIKLVMLLHKSTLTKELLHCLLKMLN